MTPLESLKTLAASLGADVKENEPMSKHTTFKIGGPADIFIVPHNGESLLSICTFCSGAGVPFLAVGNGSNLLVSDKGLRCAVIRCRDFGSIMADGETLSTPAGTNLGAVCEAARESGLSGLEFAYGIPGTVGGAVYMNAGAYGGEMKDVVQSVRHIDRDSVKSFGADELCFGYRKSVYTGTKSVITRVKFKLSRGNKAEIGKKMISLLERRRAKQPLELPSAGSVFKRPSGHFAGALIEGCGLKGARIGGAMVSEKHAGFIVNTGGATCSDVLKLMDKIKNEVYKSTGVLLECEIKVAGEI